MNRCQRKSIIIHGTLAHNCDLLQKANLRGGRNKNEKIANFAKHSLLCSYMNNTGCIHIYYSTKTCHKNARKYHNYMLRDIVNRRMVGMALKTPHALKCVSSIVNEQLYNSKYRLNVRQQSLHVTRAHGMYHIISSP